MRELDIARDVVNCVVPADPRLASGAALRLEWARPPLWPPLPTVAVSSYLWAMCGPVATAAESEAVGE